MSRRRWRACRVGRMRKRWSPHATPRSLHAHPTPDVPRAGSPPTEKSTMKKPASTLHLAVATCLVALAGTCVHAAGYQHGYAADPEGKPLEIGIWYPSRSAVQPLTMGPTTM